MLPDSIHLELVGLDFIDPDYQLRPVLAGAINRSFCLQQGSSRYFLKCFADYTPTCLDRRGLFSVQQQLAATGLAPEPVYLSTQQHFMLERWHDITTLETAAWSAAQKIESLATQMARIHQQDIVCPELDLVADWQHYLQRLGINSGPDYERVVAYADVWQKTPKTTFCHHDLAFEHLCTEPKGMVLDWEYQACSAAEFDLACAILINRLDEQQSRTLIKFYANAMQQNSLALWLQTQTMLPLAELTSDLWYRAAAQQG